MAADKSTAEHVELPPQHEAALTGALALANLFSNCVEAFGLIHPGHKWEKEEQLLLARLGIQQARLLIWGDIVGISSPPKSVTDRAVPKHPSAAYPDLKEPTFFNARDARLDEPEIRVKVENALSAIVDRSATATREEMMEKYGLKPPKRFATEHQQALDTNRLEGFRERYELLLEVAEDFAHLHTRRSNSIVQSAWMIADVSRFSSFIKLTQEKVDFLVTLMDVKEGVDRGMRMDIRGMGWHLTADRARVASDISKLRLVSEACKDEYPEYLVATRQALDQISRESRENANVVGNPYAGVSVPKVPQTTAKELPKSSHAQANGTASHKRPGLFGFLKRKSHDHSRSQSVSGPTSATDDPPRSLSDAGPITTLHEDDDMPHLEPVRSKSVGAILDIEDMTPAEEALRNRLRQMSTQDTARETVPLVEGDLSLEVSRHDQYHGIARVATKDLHQT